jgi:hypothetical protein
MFVDYILAFVAIFIGHQGQENRKQARNQAINSAECVGLDQYPILCPVKRSFELCKTSQQVMRIHPKRLARDLFTDTKLQRRVRSSGPLAVCRSAHSYDMPCGPLQPLSCCTQIYTASCAMDPRFLVHPGLALSVVAGHASACCHALRWYSRV